MKKIFNFIQGDVKDDEYGDVEDDADGDVNDDEDAVVVVVVVFVVVVVNPAMAMFLLQRFVLQVQCCL